MSDGSVTYDPMSDRWTLSDGEHCLTVPYWARRTIAEYYERQTEPLKAENERLQAENAKIRILLSDALTVMGFNGRQYLDEYLREEEGTTLIQELKSAGIEVG